MSEISSKPTNLLTLPQLHGRAIEMKLTIFLLGEMSRENVCKMVSKVFLGWGWGEKAFSEASHLLLAQSCKLANYALKKPLKVEFARSISWLLPMSVFVLKDIMM